MGALDQTVYKCRMGFPLRRNCIRQLVGVLRAWLGRLVDVGSSRKRIFHAMDPRHGVDPFPGSHREKRSFQELDCVVGADDFFAQSRRRVSCAFRSLD